MKFNHDGYGLKTLCYELCLEAHGFKSYIIGTTDKNKTAKPIYEHFITDYLNLIKVKILEIAIHHRSLDDEFKLKLNNKYSEFPIDINLMEIHYKHEPHSYLVFENQDIKCLRESSNKLIHSDKFDIGLYVENEVMHKVLQNFKKASEEDILVITGNKYGKPWKVCIDIIKYTEQIYLYADILAEYYGI